MSTKTALLFASLAISTQAWGHASFAPKDNMDAYTDRAYKEGSAAYLKLTIAHSCSNEDKSEYYPTRSVSVVFPNTIDLSGQAVTTNRDGDIFGGNAMMGIKPRVTRSFRKIKVFKGDVPEFYNHGAKNRDVRALHWTRGWVENDKYEVLEFRASLPKLEGCVKKLRVYTPTVQHCLGGHTLAWLRTPTAMFAEDVISPDYAPYFDIIRDEENNPLPAGATCSEEEMTAEAYPSDSDIDTYLPLGDHGHNGNHNTDNTNDGHAGHGGMGSDNDNTGGMSMGADNDNADGMSMGADNDNAGGMSMGADNDNADGMSMGADNDNIGDMNMGSDNDNAAGTRPADDNDNGGIIDLSNDTDNSGGLTPPPAI